VPIGLLGMVLVTLFIQEMREESSPRFDLPGFVLTGLGLSGLILGFEVVGRAMLPLGAVLAMMAAGAGALALYVRHARRVFHPLLDLSLLRIPTFRASIVGAFMFRAGIGAIPFLLPLMLQEGFGLDPFHSGLLTFASAVGALTMKITAGPILRRLGFRPVLIANALLSGAILACYGLFRSDTPAWLILGLLLVGGFFRSLQFTSMNVLAYADIPRERMSQATSFSAMCQQLSLSFGVGFGALLLDIVMTLAGRDHLVAGDFRPAFLAVGLLAALSTAIYWRLPSDAGAELSGRLPGQGSPLPARSPRD